jgi:hypothetical protein
VNEETDGRESEEIKLNEIDLDFNWFSLFKLDKTAQVKQVPESIYKHIRLNDIEKVSSH